MLALILMFGRRSIRQTVIRHRCFLVTLMRSTALVFVFAVLAAAPAMASETIQLAQAGTVGGTVGKTGKSVSGDTEPVTRQTTEPRKKPPRRSSKEAKPRRSAPSTAASNRDRYRWCSISSLGGAKNCGFESFEQCMENLRGIGGHCQVGP
jgi:hypothetical protein